MAELEQAVELLESLEPADRAGPGARGARRGAAPRAPADRRARAAAARARAGRGQRARRRWRSTCARSCTRPARGPRTTALDGRGVPHGARAARGDARGGRADQPRHRPDPVRDPQNGRGPPHERLPEAEHRLPARAAPQRPCTRRRGRPPKDGGQGWGRPRCECAPAWADAGPMLISQSSRFAELQSRIHGQVLTEGDEAWDASRQTFNLTHRPAPRRRRPRSERRRRRRDRPLRRAARPPRSPRRAPATTPARSTASRTRCSSAPTSLQEVQIDVAARRARVGSGVRWGAVADRRLRRRPRPAVRARRATWAWPGTRSAAAWAGWAASTASRPTP